MSMIWARELSWLRAVMRVPMRLWTASREETLGSIPRPTDAPRASTGYLDADRVLIIGSGPAVGWGVATHQLSLTGHLSRALHAVTRRGADVHVIADPDLTVSGVREAIAGARLWTFDAIVLIVGVNDALRLTPLGTWRREYSRLLDEVLAEVSATTHVVAVGVQPVRSVSVFAGGFGLAAERHGHALNSVTAELAAARDRVSFLPLPARPAPVEYRHRAPSDYARWADLLAVHLSQVLCVDRADGSARARRDRAPDELERREELRALGMLDTDDEERFDRIAALARTLFHTRSAAINLIDDDRQWAKAVVGDGPREVPRRDSFCAVALGREGALIVPDARLDDRFAASALVTHGDPPTRFYAGYPIEGPTGIRVGALCVYDPEPRDAATVDAELLRDLAGLVQQELWQRGLPAARR